MSIALSKRQLACVRLLAHGLSDAQIAQNLELAEGTVATYIRQAMERFGFTRVQLVLWAIEQGLVKIIPSQEKPVYVEKMQYKYNVGDRVRVRNHKYYDAEGEIVALLPYGLVKPAYDVRIDGMISAVSERSLEKIETPT